MSAKILKFDPTRKIPSKYYTALTMRGRLLQMPTRIISDSTSTFEISGGSTGSGSMNVAK